MLIGRLLLIFNKIPHCNIVSDIGTDHAFLPIHLIRNGRCQKVIATDINKPPLKVALRNSKKYQVQDKIELRLGDGISTVSEHEIDIIVIAGMGGELIASILDYDFEKVKKANMLILQAMNCVEELRIFLYENGFDIFDEELCEEGKKLYNVICAKYDGITRKESNLNIYIGKSLIIKKDPLLGKLVSKKLLRQKNMLKGLKKSTNKDDEKISSVEELIIELEKLGF